MLALYGAARRGRGHPIFTAALLFAGFLLLQVPRDMFYWPAAALAYMPALAGAAAACVMLASRAEDASTQRWIVAALVLSAVSVEVGAAFVLAYTAMKLGLRWTGLDPHEHRPSWTWWVPGIVAAWVVVSMAMNRGTHGVEVMQPDAVTLSDLPASLAAAVGPWLVEIFGLAFERSTLWALVYGIPIKVALVLGLRPLATDGGTGPGAALDAAVRAVAILASCYASIVFAFVQFGLLCCDRHSTFRQALILLALFGVARAWPVEPTSWLARPGRRLALLLVPMVALSLARWPRLRHDLRIAGEAVEAREKTWASGMDPTGSSMDFYNGPPRRLGNYWILASGETYRLGTPDAQAPPHQGHAERVARYFGKTELRAH